MSRSSENWTNIGETNSSSLLSGNHSAVSTFWIMFWIVFFSGAVLNITVIFVFLRSGKMRKNISSFLVFHLSVTHLLFNMTMPIVWNIHGPSGTSASCKILMFIDLASAATIFNSLAAIAWDRHRNIFRPFKSLAPKHFKVYLMLVAVMWIYAFVTSVPFIFSVRTFIKVVCHETNNGTEKCKEISFCHLPSDWKTKLSKTVYFLLAFIIPLLFMFLAYTRIAVNLWKRSKNGTIHSAVAKCKQKSTRLMVIAVFAFVLCWGPRFFVDLLTVYGVVDERFLILQFCSYLAQMSSASINPLIYALLSPEFRKSLRSYCCCCCSCRRCWPCDRNRVETIM